MTPAPPSSAAPPIVSAPSSSAVTASPRHELLPRRASSRSISAEDDGDVLREFDAAVAAGRAASPSSPPPSTSRGHVYIREAPGSRGRYQFGYTLDIDARQRIHRLFTYDASQPFVFTRFVTDCRAVDARMRERVAAREDEVPIDVIIELMRDASAPFGVAGDATVDAASTSNKKRSASSAASPLSSDDDVTSGDEDECAAFTPAHAPSPPSPPSRLVTLVLGMAFASSAFAAACTASSDTTSSAKRDRARLLALAAADHDIVSLNKDVASSDCEGARHFRGSIGGARCVAGIHEQLGVDPAAKGSALVRRVPNDRKSPNFIRFDRVYLDYFRFPPGYINVAYADFAPMLREMVATSMFDAGSIAVVPHFAQLHQRMRDAFQADGKQMAVTKFGELDIASPASHPPHSYTYYIAYNRVTPAEYPLQVATAAIFASSAGAVTSTSSAARVGLEQSREYASTFGGFSNAVELAALLTPNFVRLSLTTSAELSAMTFARVFADRHPKSSSDADQTRRQSSKQRRTESVAHASSS
jgi:hypothetical protein